MSSVRWADLHRWSLVWVEYGTPKKDIHTTDDIECVDCNSKYRHGVNHDNEFSYCHLGEQAWVKTSTKPYSEIGYFIESI